MKRGWEFSLSAACLHTEYEMEAAVATLERFCDDNADIQPSSIGDVCSLLWAAAIGNRRGDAPKDTPIPADTQQLHQLADNNNLIGHLAKAAVKATEPVVTSMKDNSTAAGAISKASVFPAVQLLTTFAACARSWMNYANSKDDWMMTMAIKMMIMGEVEATGLSNTLKTACLELAAALKQQQQQQESEALSCIKLLSSAVLHAVRFCFLSDRPAQLLWDPILSPMVLPAVQLAAAMLLAYTGPPAAAEAVAEAEPSSSEATAAADPAAALDTWVIKWREDSPVGQEPIAFSDNLIFAIIRGYLWKPECFTSEQPLVELMSSPDLQTVLLVNLAANAQYMHKLRSSKTAAAAAGEASSSGNQQEEEGELPLPPRWHEQLYAACGLQSDVDLTGVYELWDLDDPSLAPVQLLSLMMQLKDRFWRQHYRDMATSVGLMRVRASLQQQQQQQGTATAAAAVAPKDPEFVVKPQVRVPLLLVLTELLLMAPATKRGIIHLKAMSQLIVKGWCWDPDAAFAAAAAAVAAVGPMGSAGIEACRQIDQRSETCPTGSLVGPLLLQLAPAYLHMVHLFDPCTDQDVRPDDIDDLAVCYTAVLAVAVMADSLTGGEQLAAAFKQHPAAVSQALEAAVRASCNHVGTALTLDTTNFVQQTLLTIYADYADLPAAEASSLPNTHMPSEHSSAGSSVRGSCKPLFGLLLSSLKFTGKVALQQGGVRGSSSSSSGGPAPSIELLIHSTNTLALLLVMSDLNDGGDGGATSVRHRWLVLAGRAMMYWSQAVQNMLADARRLISSQGHMPLDTGFLGHCLETITNSVSWLGACLAKLKPAAAEPAALQQLQQLQAQLFEQFAHSVAPRVRGNTAGAKLTTQQLLSEFQRLLPGNLVLQLQQFGEGVCALLPLPFCCSSPSCRVSSGLSESESVKGGRCSGCKVAHYHPACQRAHWLQHKATCKRLKAAPEAVQACIDAA